MTHEFQTWFSELQSQRARRKRQRNSLARQCIRFVLGDIRTNARGVQLGRFRKYVGFDCTIYGPDFEIEVTREDDELGKPESYHFFCNNTFRSERITDAAVRRIVSEISREQLSL
jgi:hypothetical protein